VSEVLYSGDLWDVLMSAPMDETFPGEIGYVPGQGLPIELVKFYASCVIYALRHIHSHGLAYRNLRPENVLLDGKGQIRLCDFVFAKKISVYTDAEKEHSFEDYFRATRSFTLCSTPEYLAPEAVIYS
jgi:serine/threonine protein kinase